MAEDPSKIAPAKRAPGVPLGPWANAGPRRGDWSRIRTTGLPRRLADDVYHRLMRLSWPRLLALFITLFLAFNLIFAGLYRLDSDGLAIAHDAQGIPLFWRDFFFSVHTVATVGYGNIYPSSIYANIIVAIEITCGILYFALATGIAFARFSRPTARILFSRPMVVREVDGVPTLMLRTANQRHNMIYSAEARLSLLADSEVSGIRMRRFVELGLVRSSNPSFALTWMIMHPIDAESPLRPWLDDPQVGKGAEIVLILWGVDEVSGQTIHGRWVYEPGDIHWGGRFADVLGRDEDGVRHIDYRHFHEVLPD